MLPNSHIRILLAARASAVANLEAIDAALASAEEGMRSASPIEAPDYEPVEGCTHPKDKRVDTTAGGGSAPSFFCPGCKRTSDELVKGRG